MKSNLVFCFFGIYDRDYTRNRILLRGLADKKIQVIHCNVDPGLKHGFGRYFQLVKEAINARRSRPTVIFVAYPGQTVVWLARLLFPLTPIVFDAFVSRYDTNVFDRKAYSRKSLRGLRDFFLDWYSCRLATVILLDTHEHIAYFEKTFGVNRKRCLCVPVGSDESVFYPRSSSANKPDVFTVYFHGTFIPLHGIEYIIEAAAILKKKHADINFFLLGAGQFSTPARNLVAANDLNDTVAFHEKTSLEQLPEFISKADICLGIFGASDKVRRVIPNKVYEYLAMGMPIITADTPAAREFLTDGRNVIFCKQADSGDLAEKIMYLKEHPDIAHAIAKNGATLFREKFTTSHIISGLIAGLIDRSIV